LLGGVVWCGEEQRVTKTQVLRKQPNAVVRYFRETAVELRKVSWPTRQEARQLTFIVVVVVFVMSLLLGGLDFLFAQLIALLLKVA
jgi:preprotein translocase subunit SecE